MGDFVALLGTKGGPAIRPGSTMPTSNLLCLGGQRVVVDCGLGVSRGLIDQGMRLQDIGLIFITHLHSDHYLELGPLLHTAWTAGKKTPVQVWGPPGLAAYWQGFIASMQADIDLRIEDEGRPDLRAMVTLHEVTLDQPMVFDALQVTAMRTLHPPLIDTYALRFSTAEKAVVFSGDTAFLPTLADFARGADLLIHEAMLGEALPALVARVGNGDDRLMRHLLRSHILAADAAKIATQAGVKALALHHLIPSDDPEFGPSEWHASVAPHWNGPFHLGRDGMRIAL
ncbi:MAG: MBL fold metallo-hydrolase [Rhodobacteraceae bacterium]|nr:MBL fold metallo-hydrolase [Paracoccaceae bacterium]MCF8513974.1 MBL fold metallo-hydrolase [Paracoccaceae bacterium]MCF8518218.1 MBL fold metallo-hydrolase [Paracoccaceae bacterium]